MYQRIFGDTPDVRSYGMKFRTLVRVMLSVVVLSFVSTSIVGIFACHPVRYAWNRSIDGGCVETTPWWFSYAAINISTDVAILALPIPLINGLMRITKRQKMVLMGVFLLGAFVCVVTIVRMTTLRTGAAGHDPTYTGVETLEWTGIETNVGIICACLPLLRPVLNMLMPWFAQRTARDSHPRPTYGYSGSRPSRSQKTTVENTWSNLGKGENVIMNHISARRPESRGSSEAGITEGIIVTRNIDYSESAEDHESEKDRQYSQAIASDSVV
ncbi:uncharacterized protein LTR77_009407 [Saxophila tyrrhenica]|uniref:Rhodopsin domain-containing protein n=1 Tax=Saxophila tyrrhenica TaxID=1690608 RepID=A0AAV9P0X9_9PEZI|nr:hypothetical protein LTR77_009407 [Saxophila tyrrhenica]